MDVFAAGEPDRMGKLVASVGFFAELEGAGAKALELFGHAVVWEGEEKLFVGVNPGKRFDQRREV